MMALIMIFSILPIFFGIFLITSLFLILFFLTSYTVYAKPWHGNNYKRVNFAEFKSEFVKYKWETIGHLHFYSYLGNGKSCGCSTLTIHFGDTAFILGFIDYIRYRFFLARHATKLALVLNRLNGIESDLDQLNGIGGSGIIEILGRHK